MAVAVTGARPAGATTGAPPTAADAVPTTVGLPDDPNGCLARIWDPVGQLRDTGVLADRIAVLADAGFDVHVRVEPTLDGSVDDRQRQLERTCVTWGSGARPPGLLVLTVVPSRRQTGIYYGTRAAALDDWWTPIQTDRMNPRFRLGDYAGGLADGLEAVGDLLLGGRPPVTAPRAPAPVADSGDDPPEGSGSAGLLWLAGLGVVGVAGYGWFRRLSGGGYDPEPGGGSDGTTSSGWGWLASPRRSNGSDDRSSSSSGWSRRSSGSSSRRSSGSSSRRSGGGSSRRSGGGGSGGGSTSW